MRFSHISPPHFVHVLELDCLFERKCTLKGNHYQLIMLDQMWTRDRPANIPPVHSIHTYFDEGTFLGRSPRFPSPEDFGLGMEGGGNLAFFNIHFLLHWLHTVGVTWMVFIHFILSSPLFRFCATQGIHLTLKRRNILSYSQARAIWSAWVVSNNLQCLGLKITRRMTGFELLLLQILIHLLFLILPHDWGHPLGHSTDAHGEGFVLCMSALVSIVYVWLFATYVIARLTFVLVPGKFHLGPLYMNQHFHQIRQAIFASELQRVTKYTCIHELCNARVPRDPHFNWWNSTPWDVHH